MMSDKLDGNGHFSCPCATCIIAEALKHEQRKQYKEADSIMSNGLQYYSNMYKQVEAELNQFRARTKSILSNSTMLSEKASSNNESQKGAHSMQYQHFSHKPAVKQREFTCPVAVFDRLPNPTLKAVYPKEVVYLDGNDNQLEEIWAARYWVKSARENNEIRDNVRKIMQSEQFKSFYKDRETCAVKSTTRNPTDITNVGEPVHVGVAKINFVHDLTGVENIDPNSKNTKDTTDLVVKPVSEIVSDETLTVTPRSKNKGIKKAQSIDGTPGLSRIVATRVETAQSSSEKLVTAESINSTSSEDVRIKSNVSLTIDSNTVEIGSSSERIASEAISKLKIVEPSSSSVKLASETVEVGNNSEATLTNNVPGTSPPESCKNARVQSKIPTLKKAIIASVEEHLAVPPPVVCSETFVVAKSNPSQTYVIRPGDDTSAVPIDKETLTLVNDVDDDSDACTPSKRMSQLFKPSDLNSSTTEALFKVAIPSSTPNKRMSQFFRPSDVNTNCGEPSAPMANLSTITEISKESSSRPSQKTPLETITEAERSDEASKNDDFDIIPDPFDVELIELLLKKIQFPRREHMDGYSKINTDMALMKASSVVKLGNNKYTVVGEIGKGSYARILKLQDVKEPSKAIALKQQKPACPWEYYISKEIQRRLSTEGEKSYFIQYSDIFVYRNGSVMVSDWAPYGSILSFVNNLKTSPYHNNRCPISVAVLLSIQFVEAIQYLHLCNIIHGDVKPDNFVLFDEITTDHPCVKLIDYGRSIDMTLFPKNAAFTKVVTTEDYTCNEMKDNRPWTYQTDLFGLASTIYLLLVGDYMKTKKEANDKWALTKNLPRYINRDLWNPIFDCLLNVPSCKELPDLITIRQILEAEFSSSDRQTITQQFTNVNRLLKQ